MAKAEYTVVGTSPARMGGVERVIGKGIYGIDLSLKDELHGGILRSHVALNLDCASRCVHGAGELNQHAVARGLDDAAAMLDDLGIDKSFSECLQLAERALFIGAHEPAITGDIRRQHRRQSSFNPFLDQKCTA